MSIYTMPIYPMSIGPMPVYYFTYPFNHGYEEYNMDYIDTNLYFITDFVDFNKEIEEYDFNKEIEEYMESEENEENDESEVPYLIEEHTFEKVPGIYYLF